MSPVGRANLEVRLSEHVGFIRRSLLAFEEFPAEAQRIAVSIRVLVHDTEASTALLKQLDPEFLRMHVPDVIGTNYRRGLDGGGEVQAFLYLGLTLPGNFGDGLFARELGAWWFDTPVHVAANEDGPVHFTRKAIVVTIANRLGGAHVDPRGAPEPYSELILGRTLTIRGRPADQAYIAVAQSGAELVEAIAGRYPEV